jgi:hypothetical protein
MQASCPKDIRDPGEIRHRIRSAETEGRSHLSCGAPETGNDRDAPRYTPCLDRHSGLRREDSSNEDTDTKVVLLVPAGPDTTHEARCNALAIPQGYVTTDLT